MKTFFLKFKNALDGIITALQGSSFRIQLIIGAVIIFIMFYFPFSIIERSILFLVIFLVLAFEIINSSFERLADRLVPEDDAEIKIIKDLSAGGVLVFVVGAVIIGIIILGPYLVNFVSNIKY